MSQPPKYSPQHAFVSDSATLANFPGQALDVEFQGVKAVTDAIETNLALLQRDDGTLGIGLVGYDQLAPSLQTNGIAPAQGWATATAYKTTDSVITSNALYRCEIAHTSGTFSVDLAAGKWTYVATLQVPPMTKADIGLGNVDNTSDVNKPVSTAQAAALALKAPLASPALTGTPTAPTAPANTNNTQIATTAYADGSAAAAKTVAESYADTGDALALKKASNLADVANPALSRASIAAEAQGDYAGMSNGALAASAAAGALTVAVKTFAGADPSATDPVYFYFRDSALTAGDFTRIAVTAALSVVLGSTKTLGATSGQGLRVWIAAFNNAGTVQLAAMNCSDSSGVFCPPERTKYATAVPANATKTWYSTSAIATAAPWRFIGFCEWNSLTTAGTWVAPDIVQLFGPGTKKPGDVVQSVYALAASTTTTTSTSFVSTSSTANITPTSAANLVKCSAAGSLQIQATAGCQAYISIFRGSTLLQPGQQLYNSAGAVTNIISAAALTVLDLPNATASTTYTVKLKANPAPSTGVYYPIVDGVSGGSLLLEELMG